MTLVSCKSHSGHFGKLSLLIIALPTVIVLLCFLNLTVIKDALFTTKGMITSGRSKKKPEGFVQRKRL